MGDQQPNSRSVAQLEGVAVGDDDDVGTSRVLPDDVLHMPALHALRWKCLPKARLGHACERDQREQRVVIAGHGRDKHEQRVIVARSKLLREWPTVATWWGSSSVAMEF